ncbi:NifB/NifX family molybdenum-iron cluster-binding protein [Caminibacter mediatlanticus]|uniref:Dinitrogenase iron-molybdenum cofactor biosynthesis domain-containing protein n=1 Tax=Caminibacter mediatlanticus TB-2 TaxID=391592 RepID=A0AAI9F386_9BACT|nr:hypothetical protein [Caminibacter mediatlanticus]EDM24545.1 hypothetical protein CMTB2_03478 [Caminibacter mediatlanticus TB-2]
MKIVITSNGEFIGSKFCPHFEECKYLIVYDTKTKLYGARKSPSFNTKNILTLTKFLKQIYIKNIITGKKINDKFFKVFIPTKKDITVEEAIIDFLESYNF